MALSHVAKLTLAYRRGEVTAGQVVAALDRGTPTDRPRFTDRLRRRKPEPPPVDEDTGPVPPNTWDEVLRFWEILDERQKSELRNAKNARDMALHRH